MMTARPDHVEGLETDVRFDTPSLGVIDLSGRLDGKTAVQLEAEASYALQTGAKSLLLNCEKLNYISGGGLRTVLNLARAAQVAAGRLALCVTSPQVADMLRRAGLENMVPVYADAPTALAAMAGGIVAVDAKDKAA